MILPGSYANGFAPRDGQPLYPELWRGCVGAWATCLGPTGLTLRDWSGNGCHGTLTSMDPAADWVSSNGRYALDFDGTNDYVAITSASSIPTGTSPRSMSFWMYQRTNVSTSSPVSVDTSSGRAFLATFQFSGGIYYVWSDAVSINMTCTVAQYPPLNQWNHVSITYNGSSLLYYLNGVLQVTQSYAQTSGTTSAISIGRRNTGPVVYFDGLMDDVLIHNRVLSPNEIKTLATRRGIAYEMSSRRRVRLAATFNRRRRLLVGAGS